MCGQVDEKNFTTLILTLLLQQISAQKVKNAFQWNSMHRNFVLFECILQFYKFAVLLCYGAISHQLKSLSLRLT
jgi:hypothetical protein